MAAPHHTYFLRDGRSIAAGKSSPGVCELPSCGRRTALSGERVVLGNERWFRVSIRNVAAARASWAEAKGARRTAVTRSAATTPGSRGRSITRRLGRIRISAICVAAERRAQLHAVFLKRVTARLAVALQGGEL